MWPTKTATSHYQLQGVVAGTAADGDGIALIAIDSGAARAFRVGAAVEGDIVLLGVSPAGAILGPPNGPPAVVLEVVSGAPAAGQTPLPSQGNLSAITGAEPPALGLVAPPTQSVALAAASTGPGSSVAEDALPLPADDLSPDTVSAAQAASSKSSPGRRVRLRHLNARP